MCGCPSLGDAWAELPAGTSAPSTRCLGCSGGCSWRGGGGFPHAQREELLRLSTNWESESARMSGDGQAPCHGLQIQMYAHTHTPSLCLGSANWQCRQTRPHCVPSFMIPVHIPSGRRYCWHFGQWVPSPEEPTRLHVGCWVPLLSGFAATATHPPSTPSSGSPPVSLLLSQSPQGHSYMSDTCHSILNWSSPSASRLEEDCPHSQTFSTHQCGHFRGICTVWGRAFCGLGEGTVCAETPGYFSERRKCSISFTAMVIQLS